MTKFTTARLEKVNGKWRGVLAYKDEGGKLRRKTRRFKSTGKKAAQKELDEWRAVEEAKAACEPAPDQTVSELVEEWIEANSVAVEASTTSDYRLILKNLIAPRLGSIQVADVTPETIEKWVRSLNSDYSSSYVRRAYFLLRAALRQAVERGRIPKDPTRTVKLPKAGRAKPNALTETERGSVVNFCAINQTEPGNVGVLLALYTGMREGEICALRWRNVDLDNCTLVVAESIGHASKEDIHAAADVEECFGGFYIKAPKTADSARTVNFGETLRDVLRDRRAAMISECLAAGVPFDGSLFVLGAIDGAPIHPNRLWKHWNVIAKALNLRGTQNKTPTFHDLRHTYATASIAGGVDVKTVSNQLGHANAQVTLNIYASVDPDASRRAAATVDALYESARQSVMQCGSVIDDVFEPTGTEGQDAR